MQQFIERHRILLSRLLVAGVIALIGVTESGWSDRHPFIGSLLTAAGLALVGIAMVGRLWCNLYIVGYKNRALLATGPYAVSRNPLYFFSALGGVGVGLTTETISIGVLIGMLFAVTYPWVIATEETRLARRHGACWDEYAGKVPRFFPRLGQLTEPETYEVHPKLFRRHLSDALWFVWAAAVMTLIRGAHDMDWLPAYVTLP